jgi:fatty acyl-CoA reductase
MCFVFTVLIEKLLRTCDIRQIYLLIRDKKGKDLDERLDEMFQDQYFDVLKREKPNFGEKVTGIAGDCCLLRLGISDLDMETIASEVNVVFHMAATVRFDEKLKLALTVNTVSVVEMLKICSKISNLESFVYVSTAFSNSNRTNIEEKFYPSQVSVDQVLKLYSGLSEEKMEAISSNLLDTWPNTYTLTKHLAEQHIRDNYNRIPTAIVRPAMITSTYKEPLEGWINNFYGPIALITGIAAGVARVSLVNKKTTIQIVPVDYTANAILASAWDVANGQYDRPKIFNFAPCQDNVMVFERLFELLMTYMKEIPLKRAIWYYTYTPVTSVRLYSILHILYHVIPAFLIDLRFFLMGKKTM